VYHYPGRQKIREFHRGKIRKVYFPHVSHDTKQRKPEQPMSAPKLPLAGVKGRPVKGAEIKIILKGPEGASRPLTISKDRKKLVEWVPKPSRLPSTTSSQERGQSALSHRTNDMAALTSRCVCVPRQLSGAAWQPAWLASSVQAPSATCSPRVCGSPHRPASSSEPHLDLCRAYCDPCVFADHLSVRSPRVLASQQQQLPRSVHTEDWRARAGTL